MWECRNHTVEIWSSRAAFKANEELTVHVPSHIVDIYTVQASGTRNNSTFLHVTIQHFKNASKIEETYSEKEKHEDISKEACRSTQSAAEKENLSWEFSIFIINYLQSGNCERFFLTPILVPLVKRDFITLPIVQVFQMLTIFMFWTVWDVLWIKWSFSSKTLLLEKWIKTWW